MQLRCPESAQRQETFCMFLHSLACSLCCFINLMLPESVRQTPRYLWTGECHTRSMNGFRGQDSGLTTHVLVPRGLDPK